jgi:hypothetical protein
MPRVPVGVKVVSILGIIYAGIFLLLAPCNAVLMLHPLTPNPMTDQLRQDSVYMTYYLIAQFISLALSILLLVGSIASLKLKALGRNAMLVFAWAHIAWAALNLVFSFIIVLPRMEAAFAADPQLAMIGGMTKIFAALGAVFNIVFYVAISAVILYFFTRKVAVDAFNDIFPADPTNFPVVYGDASDPSSPPPLP